MDHITHDDIVLGASLGLDLTPEGLKDLTEKEREARWKLFMSKIASIDPSGMRDAGYPAPYDADLQEYIPGNAKVVTDAMRKSGKRGSFKEALEDALWDLGGVHYLVEVGKTAPIEFLKVASRLINVEDTKNKEGVKFILDITSSNEDNKSEGGQDT